VGDRVSGGGVPEVGDRVSGGGVPEVGDRVSGGGVPEVGDRGISVPPVNAPTVGPLKPIKHKCGMPGSLCKSGDYGGSAEQSALEETGIDLSANPSSSTPGDVSLQEPVVAEESSMAEEPSMDDEPSE